MSDTWAYELHPHADLMLFTGTGQVKINRNRGMTNAAYLQIGYDVDRYFPRNGEPKRHDVVFLGQNYGSHLEMVPGTGVQDRRDIVEQFQRSGLRFGVFGLGWAAASPQHQSGAAATYRQSRLSVSVSMTSKLARYSSDRLIRSMACGCPTLVQRFPDLEGWGLRHGENCLVWDTPQEAVALAREFLNKPDELAEMSRRGAELMKTYHNWRYRMTELSAILHVLRGIPTEGP